ncbi:hypothetical protein J6590_028989 [Homalodisca vitripennis]|nr:hypothetical protein J6590_028989 [Homalodisca vitripennis]
MSPHNSACGSRIHRSVGPDNEVERDLAILDSAYNEYCNMFIYRLQDQLAAHVVHRSVGSDNGIDRDLFDHPHYCPDLAPSDYHFFVQIIRELGGQRFETAVESWLHSLAGNFYEDCVDKLINRYDKT